MSTVNDISVSIAYLLVFFSTLGCIVYSLIHWNKQSKVLSIHKKEEKV